MRGIFERIAVGGTLYSEAARLNDLGVRPPSWRYPSKKRSPAKHWSAPTIRTIVRNTTYSGTHKITLSTGEVVEQAVPTIVEPEQPAIGQHLDLTRSGVRTSLPMICAARQHQRSQHGHQNDTNSGHLRGFAIAATEANNSARGSA